MLEQSIRDMSKSDLKVMGLVAENSRLHHEGRSPMVKFWTALYIMITEELRRRELLLQGAELELLDVPEVITEWTGAKDPAGPTTITVMVPQS